MSNKAIIDLKSLVIIGALSFVASTVFAHGVADRDALFLEQNPGMALVAFMYLGAKHMITGYDHLLYLVGVIFFSIQKSGYCPFT